MFIVHNSHISDTHQWGGIWEGISISTFSVFHFPVSPTFIVIVGQVKLIIVGSGISLGPLVLIGIHVHVTLIFVLLI